MNIPVTDELLMAVLQETGCPKPGGPDWDWWEASRVKRWAKENPAEASDRACLRAALRVLLVQIDELKGRILDP